jgi:hypothetical protein
LVREETIKLALAPDDLVIVEQHVNREETWRTAEAPMIDPLRIAVGLIVANVEELP